MINVHADDSIDDVILFREIIQLRKIQGVIEMATHSVGLTLFTVCAGSLRAPTWSACAP